MVTQKKPLAQRNIQESLDEGCIDFLKGPVMW